jgi:hypothetical protein
MVSKIVSLMVLQPKERTSSDADVSEQCKEGKEATSETHDE